jgi:hypothetical protein
MTNGKPQLHVSMLEMLSRCGIQFQRRYGARFGCWPEEEIIPPGVALAVGISVHKAVEADLSCKMNTGQLLLSEAVQDRARDAFGVIYEGGMLFAEDEAVNIQSTVGAGIDQAVALSELHHQELAPRIEPLALEERFVIDMKGWPIDLSGQKDIREKDAIRDTKTARARPQEGAAKSLQMSMYCLSEQVERGALPSAVHLDYLVKTKTPKLVTVSAVPDPTWTDPLMRRIERFVEIIKAVKEGKEAFTPASPGDWICQEKYCGYAHTCEFFCGKK